MNCRALVKLQTPIFVKEVEISGECEELRKKLDTYISLQEELFKGELTLAHRVVLTAKRKALGWIRGAMMWWRRKK